MVRYYKIAAGGYIAAIGMGAGGVEITPQEYSSIKAVIDARPTPEAGQGLRLTTVLSWEEYELSPEDAEPEISAAEALEIITGGANNEEE